MNTRRERRIARLKRNHEKRLAKKLLRELKALFASAGQAGGKA